MGGADRLEPALRRDHRPEWRGLDRLDAERPGVAARSQERRVRRVSAATAHKYPPRLRRQLHHPGELLGRQQPRRLDREGRAAGLIAQRTTLSLPPPQAGGRGGGATCACAGGCPPHAPPPPPARCGLTPATPR